MEVFLHSVSITIIKYGRFYGLFAAHKTIASSIVKLGWLYKRGRDKKESLYCFVRPYTSSFEGNENLNILKTNFLI